MNLVNITTDKMRDAMTKINANIAELEGKINNTEIEVIYFGGMWRWMMASDNTVSEPYTPPSGYKVIGYDVMIINDAGTTATSETFPSINNVVLYCSYSYTDSRFILVRETGGEYDSADYNSDEVNRGYIRVYLAPA